MSNEQWADIGQSFADDLGYAEHPWVMVRHADDHVHITVARISDVGEVWHARNDRRAAQRACTNLKKPMSWRLRREIGNRRNSRCWWRENARCKRRSKTAHRRPTNCPLTATKSAHQRTPKLPACGQHTPFLPTDLPPNRRHTTVTYGQGTPPVEDDDDYQVNINPRTTEEAPYEVCRRNHGYPQSLRRNEIVSRCQRTR
ncbi:relaxase/mobilization nuclease domain-containing protein [Glutamicibacter sp. NPDC087344]|uniref:relaxase/mobilization nuclease domain-containing protein n=1 Tax=Glutamicibacter sp. NPDC087344 TaxID=3363994 RepID=UPI00381913DB